MRLNVERSERMGIGVVLCALVALFSFPAAAAEGGLQLVPHTDRLITMLVVSVLLIFVVQRLLFAPVFQVLDERDERIDGTRKRAAEFAREAEELLTRYEEALRTGRDQAEAARKQVLEQARDGATETTTAARRAAEEEIDGARQAVGEALERARAELPVQARELAHQAAERVLGRTLPS
ncbi:ATP synthase F0 subunit B [Myxococcota bacterium]|nr:ATP synthase F0 subunit B [Myxococcota bacterium]